MATQILKLPAVQLMTGLSRTTVYRLEAEDKFPKRVLLAADGHAVGWYLHEVEEYLATRPRASGAPKAA